MAFGGTGMPKNKQKNYDKTSNTWGKKKQTAFHPTLIHVILVMLRTRTRLCRIRQQHGHAHLQVWYADWHAEHRLLQYG